MYVMLLIAYRSYFRSTQDFSRTVLAREQGKALASAAVALPMSSDYVVHQGVGGMIPRKLTALGFSRSFSSDSADLDNEVWTDPRPIPAMSLDPALSSPVVVKAKSSSSAKSRKHARVYRSCQERWKAAQKGRPQHLKQICTAYGAGHLTRPAEPDDLDRDDV